MLVRLQLTNFRNFQELDFRPSGGLMVLTGPNGAGKSNLLESIYYLGSGYSYRQVRDENLVRWGTGFFAIRGEVQRTSQPLPTRLEVAYQLPSRRKIIRINGKREHPGRAAAALPVVIFSPQDLLLIQGPPGLRRHFLDLVVTQLWPQQGADLSYYRGVLVQRNNLLRQGSKPGALEPWNEQLVTVGGRILNRRLLVFRRLVEFSRAIFKDLGGNGVLSGAYVSRIFPKGVPSEVDEETCRQLLGSALQRSRPLEERLRVTTLGPHRDDLSFCLEGHEARLYCSQGEQRLIALALKLGQSRILTQEEQAPPLLLLDDVFSELDEGRRERLLQEFCTERQVIATAATYQGGFQSSSRLTPEITALYVGGFK